MRKFKLRKKHGLLALALSTSFLLPYHVLAQDQFDNILTDGKLVIPSIEPTTMNEAYAIFEYLEKYGDYYIDVGECTNTYKSCPLVNGHDNTRKTVDISYEYDKDIKKVVDELVSNIPEKEFTISDMDYMNFALYGTDEKIFNYSSELKEYINYKNFDFSVRAGGGPNELSTKFMSILKFEYDGVVYYVKPAATVNLDKVIYVDSDTSDDKVLDAVKERMETTFGSGVASIQEEGTINDYYTMFFGEEYESRIAWDSSIAGMTKEDYIAQRVTNISEEHPELEFLNNAYDGYFSLKVGEDTKYFVVVKDSSKVQNISYQTSDIGSNITIRTDNSSIPLDTLIKVAKLTSGEEYDKIIKLLNVKNSEMFDLKLYSSSIDDYITKLDNGKFEVKIPLTDDLRDKTLAAYYVDSNNQIMEYDVKVEDGYAVFTTDHFSIYTLAEKNTVVTPTSNNPNTGDNILFNVILLLISALGLTTGFIYLRKNKREI